MKWRRPRAEEIEALLQGEGLDFSYPEVGATTEIGRPLPDSLRHRYDVDHHVFSLGQGRKLFERARVALRTWRHVSVPWVEFHGIEAPVHESQVVASLARVAGFWFLNPCRVLFVDLAALNHAGFAYGTLPGHAEIGEERFVVSLDPDTEEVSYEIAAFSRPGLIATRLGYPLGRRIQRRFAVASSAALKVAVR